MLRLTTLFLFLITTSVQANDGGWKPKESIDSMTDAKIKTAEIVNSAGHSLSVYRHADHSVWITFRINEKNPDVLGRQLPMFRVDKEKPSDGETNRELDKLTRRLGTTKPTHTYTAEPKWVSLKIFHGQGKPDGSLLAQIMNGEKILVRYYLFTGGFKETEFQLAGAQAAIESAIAE